MRLSYVPFVLAIVLLAMASAMAQSSTYQNVVVILGDDLGVDALSCFDASRLCNDDPTTGAPCSEPAFSASTPAICSDLAGSGTRFTNAWANPVCTPTRSTILTGRYGFRTGLLSAGTPLPLNPDGTPVETTLAMILSDAGFSTGIFGKWHLGGGNFNRCGTSAETHPGNHGFDVFDGAFSNIIPASAGYNNWLRTVQPGTEPDPEWDCENETEYAAFEYTDSAIAWIQQQTGPYFLWMAHHLPHTPLHVPPRKDKDACQGPCWNVQGLNGTPAGSCPSGSSRECFQAMIETMDSQIERLLEAVDLNDTLVIFLGDNGTVGALGGSPIGPDCIVGRAKATIYEGGIRVPLVIHASNHTSAPVISAALVNMTDLFKTILDLTGVAVPSGIEHDSISIVPILDGATSTGDRDYSYSELGGGARTARNARYKLLHLTSGGGSTEFYDLDQVETDSLCATDLLIGGLTPEEQDNHDDIQEYLDFLDGTLGTCPGASCSSFPGCRRVLPLQCQNFTISTTACTTSNGSFLQCAPDEDMLVRSCDCEAITPGTLCPNDDQVVIGCQ